MRVFLALLFAALGAPASAHVGHLGELAGHTHWIAGGAIGLAVLIGLLGGKKKPKEDAVEEADEAEEDLEEQAA